MKTSEFIKRVEELGYVTDKDSWYVYVRNKRSTAAIVSETRVNAIETNCRYADVPNKLFDLIVEYAKTPLEDREEPKRYVLEIGGSGSDFNSSRHYFNYIEDKNSWSLKDKNNGFMNRTIFTEKEFTQLKSKLGIELEFEKEEIK